MKKIVLAVKSLVPAVAIALSRKGLQTLRVGWLQSAHLREHFGRSLTPSERASAFAMSGSEGSTFFGSIMKVSASFIGRWPPVKVRPSKHMPLIRGW